MRILFVVICLLFATCAIQTFSQTCGVKTTKQPVNGTSPSEINGGSVRSIEGTVYSPNFTTPMNNVIAVLYRNKFGNVSMNFDSYKTVGHILEQKPIAVRLIQRGGRFCFPGLNPGDYLLRVGHESDSQFSAANVFIKVDPQAKKRSLKISLGLSISKSRRVSTRRN